MGKFTQNVYGTKWVMVWGWDGVREVMGRLMSHLLEPKTISLFVKKWKFISLFVAENTILVNLGFSASYKIRY